MRRIIIVGFWGTLALHFSSGQTASSGIVIANAVARTPTLPRYVVYRYFLGYIDTLDRQAVAAGAKDQYEFAKSFASRAGLANAELDLLRAEAKALLVDLKKEDNQAASVISAFRAKAKQAVQSGQALPPVPTEIRSMQRMRTALLIQHYLNLQTSLGAAASTRLDNYLNHEFIPHISMEQVAKPKQAAADLRGGPSFSTGSR